MKQAIEEIIDQRVMRIVKQYVDPLVNKLQAAIASKEEKESKKLKKSTVKAQDGVQTAFNEAFKKRKTSE